MEEFEGAIADARQLFDDLLSEAGKKLVAGAPIDRVQEGYIKVAFRILEQAEADALLASAGDRTALTRLKQEVSKLQGLQQAFEAEFSA